MTCNMIPQQVMDITQRSGNYKKARSSTIMHWLTRLNHQDHELKQGQKLLHEIMFIK